MGISGKSEYRLSGFNALPPSLNVISDEAFANTALESIYIPVATQQIAEDAFGSSRQLKIISLPGSYAGKWAHENGFPLVFLDLWISDFSSGIRRRLHLFFQMVFWAPQLALALQAVNKNRWEKVLVLIYEFRSMLPKDRPELHAIEYRFP